MKRTIRLATGLGAAVLVALPAIPATGAAAPKAGQSCRRVGEVTTNNLICKQEGRRRVYRKNTPATTRPPVTAAAGGTATTAAPAGLRPARGFDGTTIKIGYLGNVTASAAFPASALFADGGKSLTAGFNAYISKVNDAGGVAKKYKIQTLFKETYYDPGEASKAYADLKDQVAMIGQIYGTPLVKALRESLARDSLVASPISLDFEWVTNPWILPVGATYQAQIINAIDWWLKEPGNSSKKICSVALGSEYGLAGEEGFDWASKQLGFNTGPKLRIATSPAASPAVMQELKNNGCDAVAATVSGEINTPSMLAAGAALSYFPIILGASPSFASRTVVPANAAQFGRQAYFAADGSEWGDERVPGMKEHMADLRKYAPDAITNPNPATEWGYAQARTVVALLEKAVALGDLSGAGIQKAMHQLGKVSYGNMYPDFDYVEPAKRVPPSGSYIYRVDQTSPGGWSLIRPWDSAAARAYKR